MIRYAEIRLTIIIDLKGTAMERFRKFIKKIFFLPVLPTVIIAFPAFTLVFICLSVSKMPEPVKYISYIVSAYALVIMITAFPKIIHNIRYFFWNNILNTVVLKIPAVNRLINDSGFSFKVSLYSGLLINLLYIFINYFSGFYYHSFWFFALGFYYLLLAVMRLVILNPIHKKSRGKQIIREVKSYRLCGIILLVMNYSLSIVVFFVVNQNKGFFIFWTADLWHGNIYFLFGDKCSL